MEELRSVIALTSGGHALQFMLAAIAAVKGLLNLDGVLSVEASLFTRS